MPAITWGPQIQLGIEVIDSQHKRLVDLINELGQAMDDGRGPEVMAKTLTELVDSPLCAVAVKVWVPSLVAVVS